MRIGVFGDVHDHVDNLRRAINIFNDSRCELVLFAGDLVSPLVVPPPLGVQPPPSPLISKIKKSSVRCCWICLSRIWRMACRLGLVCLFSGELTWNVHCARRITV